MNETIEEFRKRNEKTQKFLLKIPVWNGKASLIGNMLKPDDDGIFTLRLESWEDYRKLLATPFFQKRRNTLIFRGQRKRAWQLEPVLWRGRGENDKLLEVADEEEYKKKLAARQIEEFRKRMRHRAGYNIQDMDDDDLWAIGQHQFLQTPLLDWTHSPSVALYFAFWSENSDDERDPLHEKYSPYRVIYVLDRRLCTKGKKPEDISRHKDSRDRILLVTPKEDPHGRLISQDGLFTFGPYAGTLTERLLRLAKKKAEKEKRKGEDWSYFFKILIPNRDGARQECLQDLTWMNVHPGALFPDIYGATQYCNIDLDLSSGKEDDQGERIYTHKKTKCRKTYLASHINDLLALAEKVEKDRPRLYIANHDLDLEMVLIQAGTFTMGHDDDRYLNANPAHIVEISRAFYLGRYPVTQRQWDEVMKDEIGKKEALKERKTRPDFFNGFPDHPVVGVSWPDAQDFINKLNEKLSSDLPSSWRFRLPTEAEWEYACRAGKDWPWSEDENWLEQYAWYENNSGGRTHCVGVKAPNNWGLYDMLGNVWEWCEDWYGSGYYQECKQEGVVIDPRGPSVSEPDKLRVNRGGGWGSEAKWAHPANHGKAMYDKRDDNIGFRLALTQSP